MDQKRIRLHFDNAAARYDQHAYVQQKIMQKALALVEPYIARGAFMLDVGCGTGAWAGQETAAQNKWKIIQVDLSYAMCANASQKAPAAQANVMALPFAQDCFDAVITLSTLQWVTNQAKALDEISRVLKPGGLFVLYVFGTATLQELKKAFTKAGNAEAVNGFHSADQWQRTAMDAGFDILQAGQNLYTDYYSDVASLLRNIKAIGASSVSNRPRKGLRRMFTEMEAAYEFSRTESGLPVTWDVVHLVGRK